jgi:predicted DNA-binding transcriptional regulator AlpA
MIKDVSKSTTPARIDPEISAEIRRQIKRQLAGLCGGLRLALINADDEAFMDKQEVSEICKIGVKKRNAMEKRGEFPKRRWQGPRAYWLRSEITAWLRSRPSGISEPVFDPSITTASNNRRWAQVKAERQAAEKRGKGR